MHQFVFGKSTTSSIGVKGMDILRLGSILCLQVTVADAYTSNDYDLLSPKAGRYVRFVVVENQNHVTEKNNRLVVRLEFYGCSMSGDAVDAGKFLRVFVGNVKTYISTESCSAV